MKLETLTPIIQKIDTEGIAYSSEEYAARILEEVDQLPERYVFIGKGEVETSDGGISEMIEIIDEDELEDEEVGLFVRVLSWDPEKRHVALKPFKDTKMMITVELA